MQIAGVVVPIIIKSPSHNQTPDVFYTLDLQHIGKDRKKNQHTSPQSLTAPLPKQI